MLFKGRENLPDNRVILVRYPLKGRQCYDVFKSLVTLWGVMKQETEEKTVLKKIYQYSTNK